MSLSLSLCLVRLYLKTRIWCRLFPERENWDPPPNYPIIIRRPGNLIYRWRRREKRKTTTEKKNQTI
jgi:hypothetical protein